MHLEFKKEFVDKFSRLTDFKEYSCVIDGFSKKAIRVNTLKSSVSRIKKDLSKNCGLIQVPWCKEGFWIEGKRRDLGNLYEHQLGYIYVQDAASMIPPLVLGPKKNEIVLDAAASPGSKTTQLAAIMENTGLIVANDVTYMRMMALSHNLQRCGVSNVITTISDARRIDDEFSKILVDVPCSGTGTIFGPTRDSFYTIQSYSLQKVKTLSGIQKKILLKAYENLKSKGVLVYSTCSLEPEEDEDVIQFLLDNTDAQLVKIGLDIKSEVNLDYGNYSSELKKCIKLWPQFYRTEGFFVAKIKKR